eukprot:scaffold51828_cov42-Prasinocladus_malaysianus.AAC.1
MSQDASPLDSSVRRLKFSLPPAAPAKVAAKVEKAEAVRSATDILSKNDAHKLVKGWQAEAYSLRGVYLEGFIFM